MKKIAHLKFIEEKKNNSLNKIGTINKNNIMEKKEIKK
jgi:hypothetical protein